MAQIDVINQRLEDCIDEAEAIKNKIKEVAESKGVTIVDGTDTPLSVLDKVDNATIETPTGTINITENGTVDVTNYSSASVLVQSEDGAVVKGLADGSLTSFKASDYGVTSLKPNRFQNFTSLQSLDLTGITNIPDYTAYRCTGLTSLTIDFNTTNIGQYAFQFASNTNPSTSLMVDFIVDDVTPTVIGAYAFENFRRLKIIKGYFGNIGANAFYSGTNSGESTSDIDIKIDGALNSYAFCGKYYVTNFNLSSDSNITLLNSYAFSSFGSMRSTPENNVFTFDFRNSTFSSVGTYCFMGSSTYKNQYFNIYFPTSLTSLSTYCFQLTDYFNIYYKNIPTLVNTSSFSGATNYKNFFPYNLAQSAKVATNWVSIASSIYGYSDTNEFSLGDTLPETDSDGYALTWYSDREMTTQVTIVTDPTQMYYCQVGTRIKVKLSSAQYQAILTVSDGTNTYTNGSLVPIGATLTITAVGDTGYPDPYIFTLNGTTIVSGDSYTVAQDNIAIVCIYYDGVNSPVEANFADNTPQQIKIAVDNGLHRILWTIGDAKTITLTNNNTVTLTYVDQQANRYEKVDGTGYSNAVFEITPLFGTYSMNGGYTNTGGWPASRMNTVVMSTLYDLLPSDWQAVISEVKVPSSAGSQSSNIVYANNKVFIASAQEMFNSYFSNAFDEGTAVFDYYDGAANSKRIKQYNGSNYYYWLRSPSRTGSNGFCIISTSGSLDGYIAYFNYGVAACLSI